MKFQLRNAQLLDMIRFNEAGIISRADKALQAGILSITDHIAVLSEGGPHDYYSNGDYWWPDPAVPDGLPYIRRDGESNPAAFNEHRTLLRSLRTNIAALAAAYRLTGSKDYAQKAQQLLEGFFINPKTRMAPHLRYAQAIPGICSGRGIGIIDTLHLIELPVAIDLLRDDAGMDDALYRGLREWFRAYLRWMTTYPYGVEEMNTSNNHAVCWFVQAATLARFTENQVLLEFCREEYRSRLLPDQMAPDGSFPEELARTKPYGYSIFTLDNLITLCHILSTPTSDLWDFTLPDGRNIRRGLEFLTPYLAEKGKWPYMKDIEHFDDWPVAVSMLLFAGIAFGETQYIDLWQRLPMESSNLEVRRNIAIRQPFLWLMQK
jgi:hypothetical protein